MKILKYSGYALLNISLFFVLLFTSVQIVSTWDGYYRWHYNAHGIGETTGMDEENFMDVSDKMMAYLLGKRNHFDMEATINGEVVNVFGEREIAHMVDVKNLFIIGKTIRNGSAFLLFGFILISFWRKKKILMDWIRQLNVFFIGTLGIAVFLGLLLYMDFSRYFVVFHEIFFTNDLWLLDPRTSVLINMLPEVFFNQMATMIVALFLVMIVITIVLRKITLIHGSKKWRL